MKKIFLTTIALLTMASASVFGMYGVGSGEWIGFLTHGSKNATIRLHARKRHY